MKRITWLAAAALVFTGAASAATVTLQSNYVRAVVTDGGVLSSLRYDATGTGNFPSNKDYVSPGIPFEGFGIEGAADAGAFNLSNANSSSWQIGGTTAAAVGGFDFGALWTGETDLFSISHLFFFNAADQRVNIRTTLTAKAGLSNVRVSRAVDPDPDNYSGGSASTNNQRGIAGQGVSVNDFVGSLGSISGLPLGLYYNGSLAHNTGIVEYCCGITDPDTYLAGGELGNSSSGDHGIGLGFNLGDLARGGSVSWNYAYVMGGSLGTIDIPGGGTVPEPTSLALIGLALVGAVSARRRKA